MSIDGIAGIINTTRMTIITPTGLPSRWRSPRGRSGTWEPGRPCPPGARYHNSNNVRRNQGILAGLRNTFGSGDLPAPRGHPCPGIAGRLVLGLVPAGTKDWSSTPAYELNAQADEPAGNKDLEHAPVRAQRLLIGGNRGCRDEGAIGVALFRGRQTTMNRAVVQSAGSAYQMTAARLKVEFERHGQLYTSFCATRRR